MHELEPGVEGTWPTSMLLDKLLDSLNKRFDLLEEKLESLTSNQAALTKRVEDIEQQGSDHERCIYVLEQKLTEG